MPQLELVREKGFDVLCLTEDVDEFVIKILHDWDGKEFKSVTSGELDLGEKTDKDTAEKKEKESKDMLDFITKTLEGKVNSVKLSRRLKSHPVCLSAEGEVSLEMEKVLNAIPMGGGNIKAKRVLELNPDHPVFGALVRLYEQDKDKLSTYCRILYGQALLIEGLSPEDPVAFSEDICSLMQA